MGMVDLLLSHWTWGVTGWVFNVYATYIYAT